MAAKLKKRALAEFSHVIQEEPKPVKRLRLIQKPTQQELYINFTSASSSQESLQMLVSLEQKFPLDQAGAERVFPEIMEHYNGNRDTVVRSKILAVLNRMVMTPGFNPQVVSDQLLPKLKSEKSHRVLSLLLSVLKTIGCCLANSPAFHAQLVAAACPLLKSQSHLVRARCLELIGELGSCDDRLRDGAMSEGILSLLGQHTSDDEPRVRTSAFRGMLCLYERGQSLDQSIYSQACSGLQDDCEDVRRAAVKLVWVLSRLYPENLVNTEEGGQELRLVDDGFSKICNMVQDISMKVRMESASLLGSLHQVSSAFLEQTLDKKLMSNMRRKVSAHDRAKENFQSGEWATGARWADDKPREALDADSVSLMNIGACGAFVHGLEDEYLEVRNAALDSLCELAYQSPKFAVLSQDSIIDMVNDEIESVRLNAINSLRKLTRHLILRDDQLEIILGVLQDFSFTTREALRGLLGEIRVATRESVSSTVMALLDNLRRYPEDRTSVWRCSQKLGQRHPQLTMMVSEELLCLHPYFDSPEPDMDDPAYVTVLLAVFNAAAICPTMVALFPEHTRRHYTYLRSSMPELVPPIQAIEGTEMASKTQAAQLASNTRDFLKQLTGRLAGLSSLDLDTAEQLLSISVRDLQHVQTLDEQTSASAECTCLFLSSQLLLTQILQQTTQLQTLFLGLSSGLRAAIRQTEIKALMLQLLLTLSCASLGDKIRACNTFRQFLGLVKSSVDSEPDAYESLTKQIVSLYDSVDWSRLQMLYDIVHNFAQMLRPSALTVPCNVKKTKAIIHEPPPSSDNAVKFPANLAANVTLVAEVNNLEDTNRLGVLVRYPDQRVQVVTPQATAWKRLGQLRHRLVMQVLLAHGLWSGNARQFVLTKYCTVLEAPPMLVSVGTSPALLHLLISCLERRCQGAYWSKEMEPKR
ncbi:hypothetical protein C0Q70_21565 [Pomacea canaliculata]|uniref:Integrator complex subunit 4 n=1 Tax=Pomacea canaliculata TaxID=400727 RepID=A0A2T7NCW0_POMCA|nr:hypothetical protein C0Q70_21565 [Pomacea canaliculata]